MPIVQRLPRDTGTIYFSRWQHGISRISGRFCVGSCKYAAVCVCACVFRWVDELCSYSVHFVLTAILSLEVGLC